jgi:hypothetical protein
MIDGDQDLTEGLALIRLLLTLTSINRVFVRPNDTTPNTGQSEQPEMTIRQLINMT